MITQRIYKTIIILLIVLGCLILSACILLNQPKFGKLPTAQEIEAIIQSPNYINGAFQNQQPTQLLVEGANTFSIIWDNHFTEKVRTTPKVPLPIEKTNLSALDKQQDLVIWLGHSSYFIQMGGKRILIDPVLSNYASPFSFINKTFKGTDLYQATDFPEIDYLIISHDHWDHLDYPSVIQLRSKVHAVVTPLGVGSHLRYWGYTANQIHEADWYSTLKLDDTLTIDVLPARHYSGRLFSKNKTLWASFALTTANHRIFFSGDSGYGSHFKQIATQLKDFDLVMLDSGQYDKRWPYIHMTPEEAVKAAQDLQAKVLLPAHTGKFTIANHAWDEPFIRIVAASKDKSFKLATPLIGQIVLLNDLQQQKFIHWWEGLD